MTCPHCGTETPPGAATCSACKAPLSAPFDVTLGGAVVMPPLSDSTPDLPDLNAFETIAQTPASRPATGTGRSAGISVPPRFGTGAGASAGVPMPPPAGTGTGQMSMIGPGQTVGARYQVIRLLGVGGMGAVYHAWDAELGVAVALKVIRTDVSGGPDATAAIERQFKQELLLARQVTHKHVVRIHDLEDIDGVKFITMPYVQGADLATVLKQAGRLPISRTLKYLGQIVDGLVAAHEAGVVHRDLKPANIMIDVEDQALIMDFGIARASTNTHSGVSQVVGTLAYMAPEQAQAKTTDQRADVYALGMMAREMLVGRTGGDGQQAVADLMQRIREAPPRVRTIDPLIPEPLDALVARCVEPDPADRFQTSAELAAALQTLDGNGHLHPSVVSKAPLPWRLIAASVVVVAGLLSGTWWFTRIPPPVKPHDPVTVLIADFNNNTGDPTFDRTLESMLRLALEGAGFINAYDRSRVRGTFGVQPPEKLDEAAARLVAMKQGVGIVLSGAVERNGDAYDISIKAAQPISGNVTVTTTSRASNKDQVLATVTKLAATVRKALGEKTSQADQLFAMRSISTGSLEVISQYAAGIELQAKGEYEEAIQKFLKAVAIDPNFGLAYNSLSVNFKNVGSIQESEKYAKEALRHLDGMTERERFATRGNYYRITGDVQQCIKEYGELIARYSADTVAHNNRALCLGRLRDFRGAMEEMRQALTILPNHMTYRANLALFADYGGDFATAEKEVRSIPQPSAGALQALPLSLVGQGRLQEAAESYEKMSTMGAFGASFAAAGLGDLALYEGRFSDAVRIFEQAAAAAVTANNPDVAAMKFAALAYAQLSRGQHAAAIAAADKALSSSTALSVRFLSARILVEAGAVAKAEPIAASLASELATERQAYGKIIGGEIALKKKDVPQAITILTEANALVDTWLGHFDLGRAYLEGQAFARADAEFDRCLKRRGEALSLVDEDPTYAYFPPAYYYLGRAREGLQSAGYKDVYGEYLKIRGKSTEDPLLPDIRRRVR